jgi:hypothetical protein
MICTDKKKTFIESSKVGSLNNGEKVANKVAFLYLWPSAKYWMTPTWSRWLCRMMIQLHTVRVYAAAAWGTCRLCICSQLQRSRRVLTSVQNITSLAFLSEKHIIHFAINALFLYSVFSRGHLQVLHCHNWDKNTGKEYGGYRWREQKTVSNWHSWALASRSMSPASAFRNPASQSTYWSPGTELGHFISVANRFWHRHFCFIPVPEWPDARQSGISEGGKGYTLHVHCLYTAAAIVILGIWFWKIISKCPNTRHWHFYRHQLPRSGNGIPASGSLLYLWSQISPALPSYDKWCILYWSLLEAIARCWSMVIGQGKLRLQNIMTLSL